MSDPDRSTERMARLVAGADVLAADLLVGGAAREAMDLVREHDWLTLVGSEALLDDAEAVIDELSESDLAADWRDVIESRVTVVEHPSGDHPALASAYRGDAGHVLTFDEDLLSARAGMAIKDRVEVSVRRPEAFVTVFDADAVYEAAFEDPSE